MANIATIMRIANNLCSDATTLDSNRFRVAAIVTDKRGKIISQATNSYNKTHPLQKEYADKVNRPTKIFLHAEIAALVKCRHIPHTIYVSRFFRDGKMALAKPCPVCEMALREAGVKKVIYTTEKGIKEYAII
jgi:tRNA(Arg) A34 adenosine deaminase TadA